MSHIRFLVQNDFLREHVGGLMEGGFPHQEKKTKRKTGKRNGEGRTQGWRWLKRSQARFRQNQRVDSPILHIFL